MRIPLSPALLALALLFVSCGVNAQLVNSNLVRLSTNNGLMVTNLVGQHGTNLGSVRVGTNGTAAPGGTALGALAFATNNAVALGTNANATGPDALAAGSGAAAAGSGSVSIGPLAVTSSGGNNIAVGPSASSAGNSIAIGGGATASHTGSVALGTAAATTTANQIMLGNGVQGVVIPSGLLVTGNQTNQGTFYVTRVTSPGNLLILSNDASLYGWHFTNGFIRSYFNGVFNMQWGRGISSIGSSDGTPNGVNLFTPNSGSLFLINAAGTGLAMLGLGPQVPGSPGLKPAGPGIQFRLADDSGYAGIDVGSLTNQSLTPDTLTYADANKKSASVTIGANLTFTGGTLSATGGGSSTNLDNLTVTNGLVDLHLPTNALVGTFNSKVLTNVNIGAGLQLSNNTLSLTALTGTNNVIFFNNGAGSVLDQVLTNRSTNILFASVLLQLTQGASGSPLVTLFMETNSGSGTFVPWKSWSSAALPATGTLLIQADSGPAQPGGRYYYTNLTTGLSTATSSAWRTAEISTGSSFSTAGGGSPVVSAFQNPGDGAVVTNSSPASYGIFKNFNTNKTGLIVLGDSLSAGNNTWWGQFTNGINFPGWASMSFYTNGANPGETLNTNRFAELVPLAPGTGTNIVLFIWYGANDDGNTAAQTCAAQSNLWKMAKSAGFIVWDFTVTTRTNETFFEKKKTVNEYKRRAVMNGQIDGLTDVDTLMSPLMFNPEFSDDGLHFTSAGFQMIARQVDSTIRKGPRNYSALPNVVWNVETQTNASTNLNFTARSLNGLSTRLVTVDAQNGNTTFAGTVTGGIGIPFGWNVFSSGTVITNGTGLVTRILPRGFTVTSVLITVATVSSSGPVTVDILENGSSIFSVLPSIDAGEPTSDTGTPGTLQDTSLARLSSITTSVTAPGTNATGLDVWLIGYWQ